MKQRVMVDTNVIVRYLLKDNLPLFSKAEALFQRAQNGQVDCYLDEVVVAEITWLLVSFYELKKEEIAAKMMTLTTQSWIVNPRKDLIIEALGQYRKNSLSYIDCWLWVVAKDQKINLETFDARLKKLKW